mmetsp:Transcript_15775/g.41507  ORF Transcript_15775/g.41507 Transcript_15775/m.41507 type:complete len:242 (-) Transcript_15775:164-889(-)
MTDDARMVAIARKKKSSTSASSDESSVRPKSCRPVAYLPSLKIRTTRASRKTRSTAESSPDSPSSSRYHGAIAARSIRFIGSKRNESTRSEVARRSPYSSENWSTTKVSALPQKAGLRSSGPPSRWNSGSVSSMKVAVEKRMSAITHTDTSRASRQHSGSFSTIDTLRRMLPSAVAPDGSHCWLGSSLSSACGAPDAGSGSAGGASAAELLSTSVASSRKSPSLPPIRPTPSPCEHGRCGK